MITPNNPERQIDPIQHYKELNTEEDKRSQPDVLPATAAQKQACIQTEDHENH